MRTAAARAVVAHADAPASSPSEVAEPPEREPRTPSLPHRVETQKHAASRQRALRSLTVPHELNPPPPLEPATGSPSALSRTAVQAVVDASNDLIDGYSSTTI